MDIKNIDLGCYDEEHENWHARVCRIYLVRERNESRIGLLVCGNRECTFIDNEGEITYCQKEHFEEKFKMIADVTSKVSIKVE